MNTILWPKGSTGRVRYLRAGGQNRRVLAFFVWNGEAVLPIIGPNLKRREISAMKKDSGSNWWLTAIGLMGAVLLITALNM
jgi:hypothetical protein